ncbi:retrovirus-related pol polyprotein from transposon TNT 1-94 [Tanacetum coccineum]
MSSPHKPLPKPSRVAKISVRPTWRKKLNHCNSSNDVDVNLPTPMLKPQSPIIDTIFKHHSYFISNNVFTNNLTHFLNSGVIYEDEAKRRNSGAKTKTFEEKLYMSINSRVGVAIDGFIEGVSVWIVKTVFGAEASSIEEDGEEAATLVIVGGYLSDSAMVISSTKGFNNLIASVLSSDMMWKVSSIYYLLVLKTLKALETTDSQLNQEIFQQTNSVLDQNAPSFTQLFELSELRAQSQAKDTVIIKLKEQIKSLKGNVDDSKVKMDMDEIETLNIELEHRVTKLVAENEHLKQTYKQLYDSIKPKRVQSKEQCDALIKQVNIKSGEISDLNAKLQEQGLVIAALKNELRKLKGKAVDKEAIETHSVDPNVSKDNMEPITPKLLNKRTAHSSYIKHTQEEALVLRDIVEHVKANYPQDSLLESAFRYTKVIQDLLSHISRSCPSINNFGPQLVEVTPRKKDKKVRFAESLTSTENTKTDSTSNIVSNKRVLHSTGVRLSTSASGSQPSGNTRNDRILQTPSSNSKNKVEAHPRNVKSSLNKRNGTVKVNGSASVQNSKKQDNSDYVCINSDDCMSSDNLCVSNSMNDVKFRAKSKKRKSKKEIWKPTGKVFNKMGYIWRPTGRTFTIVGNACPLTRITTTNEVPSRKPIVLESESPKPVVKLVYSRKPRKNKNTESVSKTKVVQIVLWYLDSGCSKHMTGDRSQLTNFISKFLCTVKFGNDQVAKIMGYGDYQIVNVTISRVYYVKGLGHNLFSVGQFCDSNLEVAFHQHACFIRNLEGVDLLTGSRGDNLYTLSLGNMMASSPICLLLKASKTKSWLWHRRLSHLNFGAINHLARHGLVRGLPKLKFEKDHLCSACALGKSSKKPHKPKSEDTNQEKLYLLHMDLCGPMRVASVNGKKYILVIVDDYSRFTWVKCLRSKDEALVFIINFLKMIQVRLKETVRRIRTDNGTEFVNQTLREYYEKVGISHETSVARSPQQNGVIERQIVR